MANLIYEEKLKQHQIDSCLPQISAVEKGQIELHALTHGNYPGREIPATLIPEISSMGFMDAVGEQDWGMEDHRNEGIEICLQESGENVLIVDGNNYTMQAKTISITRPWQLHRVGNPYLGPGRLHWIIIDVGVRRPNQNWEWPDWCVLTPEDLEELTIILRGNEHPVWKADSELIRIFQRLSKYTFAEDPEDYASRIIVTINQLLIALLELLRTHRVVTNSRLTTTARTIDLFLNDLNRSEHMLALPWTLETMAEHCGFGRTTFSSYCYQLRNTSPITFLNHCRLKHACRRLRQEPDMSITSIAFDLGFSSSQYFSKTFKKAYGMPPNEWRRKHF